MVMNNIFTSFSHFFISLIGLLFVIFPQYVYACDIRYYPIIPFIFNIYFLENLLFTSKIYLVSLCCWCIWLSETLFQTRQTFPLLPKGIIWYSMNRVSTESTFCSWSQISNSVLYSLHDLYLQHCLLIVPR